MIRLKRPPSRISGAAPSQAQNALLQCISDYMHETKWLAHATLCLIVGLIRASRFPPRDSNLTSSDATASTLTVFSQRGHNMILSRRRHRSSSMRLLGGRGGMAQPHTHSVGTAWTQAVKRIIARFARGSISAQEERILLPEEQEAERKAAKPIAQAWRHRFKGA